MAAWGSLHSGDALPPATLNVVAAVGAAVAFLVVFGLAMSWLHVVRRELLWDGQQWRLAGQPSEVGLMLCAGAFVLLRLRAAGGTTWLAVERTEAGVAWHGLLVALHAMPAGTTTATSTIAEGQAG